MGSAFDPRLLTLGECLPLRHLVLLLFMNKGYTRRHPDYKDAFAKVMEG
jgi:hypothetical protein